MYSTRKQEAEKQEKEKNKGTSVRNGQRGNSGKFGSKRREKRRGVTMGCKWQPLVASSQGNRADAEQ